MSAINALSATGLQSRPAKMTISRKIVAIVILSVGFGFVVMIGVQITGERAAIHDLAHRNSLQATKLLATVAAGVQWRQSDTIERSYQSFLEEAQTELASIVTLDIYGEILTEHSSENPKAYDLGMTIEEARQGLSDRDDIYIARYPDHIVVVAQRQGKKGNSRG